MYKKVKSVELAGLQNGVVVRSFPYQIIGGQEREESLFFLLYALLKSRLSTGLETEDDEDVNVYLSSLLHDFLDGSFQKTYGSVVSSYDSDVVERADSDDARRRYLVYRANADYALLSVSLFDRAACEGRRSADGSIRRLSERGSVYYRFSTHLVSRLGRRSAVSEVLGKLAEGFDTYVQILTRLRFDHLGLLKRLSRGEVFHLQREVHEGARPGLVKAGRDWFLDAYGDWLSCQSETNRERVNELALGLGELDPTFAFEPLRRSA